ncbi:MAG: hypothetical protein WBD20_23170 [Pirellulaceae bacterium]
MTIDKKLHLGSLAFARVPLRCPKQVLKNLLLSGLAYPEGIVYHPPEANV